MEYSFILHYQYVCHDFLFECGLAFHRYEIDLDSNDRFFNVKITRELRRSTF